MSTVKPLILWGHKTGTNSWKVAFVLEELGVAYEHKFLEMAEMKKEPYESLNPNGRVPTIEDPNTGLTIWESGACIDYILEKFDKDNKLLPNDEKIKWTARSWRDFQMSGQGPYFGQYSWFINYHPEHIPSVVSRFGDEILRITSVIDKRLSQTNYLAGERLTYADLMWLPYFIVAFKVPDVNFEERFPNWGRWWRELRGREAVGRVWDEWMERRKEVLGEKRGVVR